MTQTPTRADGSRPGSTPPTTPPIQTYADIPGWFSWLDRLLFAALLDVQSGSDPGVLIELGVYQGKSAVVIGDFVRPGERFVALDLFGRPNLLDPPEHTSSSPGHTSSSPGHQEGNSEVRRSYGPWSRAIFERNYLALHDQLPEIVAGLSSSIVDHVEPATARFMHVDASHLYNQVRIDVASTQSLLRPGGVAVFDVWRSEHVPGVSAAVWEAVFTRGLIPIALTPYKFYGVYSDPEPYRFAVQALIARETAMWTEEQQIAGEPVVSLKLEDPPQPALTDADLDAVAERLAETLVPRLPVPTESAWRKAAAALRSARRRTPR